VIVMTACSLAAALLYGAGAAVEQRQAARAPRTAAGRPRLLALLVRQPLWLLGLAAQLAGFAAHAAALRTGPLAVVQVLVGGELVVAVVIVRLWSGRKLSGAAWIAALTVVAGIASFTALTSLANPSSSGADPGELARRCTGLPAAAGAALLGAAAAGTAVAGLRSGERRRAFLLALAAGLADACSAVVTMAFVHVAGHGAAALATSWAAYALIVAGTGNVLLTQTAYQAGRPLITLPLISAVSPLASVAVAAGLLGEKPGGGAGTIAAAGAVVVVTGLALAVLARYSAPEDSSARYPRKSADSAGGGRYSSGGVGIARFPGVGHGSSAQYRRAARRAGLRLLARREGQLHRGPGRGRGDDSRLSRYPAVSPGQPGLPAPDGALPGRR
jgi:drug/metabolite transporter (DMT)-like permease